MTVVLRDITELHLARAERQARAALEAANRAKTEFLSRMSHELRTPLNAVLGFAQLLRLDAARPPTVAQLDRIQHIENAGAHLLALVNDVLDLSRVESGQMMVSMEAVDLHDAVADALGMVSPLAAEAGVHFQVVEPERRRDRRRGGSRRRPSSGLGPRRQAARAPGAGQSPQQRGQVQPRRRQRRGRAGRATANAAAVRIADSGIGMTSEKLQRLFEPFNRLGAEKSNIEGTGIGLVLSRRLVELMGGELADREHARPRHGRHPRPQRDRAARGAGSDPHAPPSQHGSLDGTLARSLRRGRRGQRRADPPGGRRCGPTVDLSVATNGARALEMARRDPPDLMLVDMNLGDMTGLELAQRAASEPADRRPPPGRAVGRRLARADQRDAGGGLRDLPHQAGRLPQVPRRARRPLERRGVSGAPRPDRARMVYIPGPPAPSPHGRRDDAGIAF